MPDLRIVTALPQSLRPAYEALLASAGLRDEGDADCTALLSSDGGALLACGSVSGRVLKQIAVALPLPGKIDAKDVYGVKLAVVDPSGKTVFSQVYPLSRE